VLFGVPILGSMLILALLTTLFITTNLSIGFTFSTIVQNQLQAMQLSMMFFLRAFCCRLHVSVRRHAGMGAIYRRGLPLAHYVRIVRAIMLKGATPENHNTIQLRCCVDAAGHDDRRDALPPHAGLRQYAFGPGRRVASTKQSRLTFHS
jgi:hypothetical protein